MSEEGILEVDLSTFYALATWLFKWPQLTPRHQGPEKSHSHCVFSEFLIHTLYWHYKMVAKHVPGLAKLYYLYSPCFKIILSAYQLKPIMDCKNLWVMESSAEIRQSILTCHTKHIFTPLRSCYLASANKCISLSKFEWGNFKNMQQVHKNSQGWFNNIYKVKGARKWRRMRLSHWHQGYHGLS